tara:strand:+ start:2069 stop:3193 length:1125 start_codon:yes stop_codon:yes gene_type:complete
MAHAKLSASSSARWLNCTASVEQVSKYPNASSPAAMEGTAAHELGDICLSDFNKSPSDFLGKSLFDEPSIVINAEMILHIQDYVDYVKSFMTSTSNLMVEAKVSYSDYAHQGFGTSDVVLINDDTCHIIDLKYGRGISVDAENNTQLMLYALGVYQEFYFKYDFKHFELHIFQPRTNNITQFYISLADLLEFGQKVKKASWNIMNDSTAYAPSDKACQWCPHKGNCNALQTHTEKVIGSEFDDLTLSAVETVDYQLILDNKSLIESWLKAVEEVAFDKLSNDEPVKGYKLVQGRSTRRWNDTEQAAQRLEFQFGEKAFTKKIISPTQAEKLYTKSEFNDIAEFITKPVGKPTLAKESDKRISINNCNDDFEVLK